MQIQVVAIRGTRTAIAKIFERTLKLAERAEVRAELNIRVEQIALEQKAILVRRFLIEHRFVVAFVFEPRLAAERDIDIRPIQRNEFHWI